MTELKELIDNLRFKWKGEGYHAMVEKKNHISYTNNGEITFYRYLVIYKLWKEYSNEYRYILREAKEGKR